MKYHAGEIEVQKREGVRLMADRIGNGIRDYMPDMAMFFLDEKPFGVASGIDDEGLVWASPLAKSIVALDERHLYTPEALAKDDPLYNAMSNGSAIGMIFIEFATRRRMRINGQVQKRDGTSLEIQVQQAYSNCPKHIHPREHSQQSLSATRDVIHTASLSESQREWIETADTLFIASLAAEGGADASHRGGESGFVHVLDEGHIQIPDYAGNMMFNTLGNIMSNPALGLLFINFETGAILQVSGQATISWDESLLATFPHAKRVIELTVRKVIER